MHRHPPGNRCSHCGFDDLYRVGNKFRRTKQPHVIPSVSRPKALQLTGERGGGRASILAVVVSSEPYPQVTRSNLYRSRVKLNTCHYCGYTVAERSDRRFDMNAENDPSNKAEELKGRAKEAAG